MKNKSLASMAYSKLSAIRDDMKCKMCDKSAREGCECDERDMDMPEDSMEEESVEESEPMYKKDEERAPGVVINIALGKKSYG